MKNTILKTTMAALSFVATGVSAQTEPEIPWAINGGGNKDQHGMCVSVDGSGNSFVGGFFSDSATFGNTTLKGIKSYDADAFVAKLDANGNFLWAIRVASNSTDWVTGLSNDANGNCYVVGTCSYLADTIYFGNQKIVRPEQDAFIAKINPSGNIQWVKTGLTGGGMYFDIATSASGVSYIAGSVNNRVEFNEAVHASGFFILKIDADGNILWTKSALSPLGGAGHGVSMDKDGNGYVTGNYENGENLSKEGGGFIALDDPAKSSGGYIASDVFLAKFNSDGNFLWAMGFPGNKLEQGLTSSTDAAGNVYVSGVFEDTITIGTIQLVNTNPPIPYIGDPYDVFFTKIDPAGNVLWAKKMEIEIPPLFTKDPHSRTDANGNSYLTGPKYISKIDSNGDSVWSNLISGMGGRGIAVDPVGNAYASGSIRGTATFGDTTLESNSIGPYQWDSDVFVVKLGNAVNSLGVKEVTKNNFLIYPNPANNFVTLTNLSNNTSVNITDLAGKQVYSTIANTTELSINTSGFANGVYIVMVSTERKSVNQKLIINH